MMSDEVSVLGSLCTTSTRHFSSWHPLQNVTMIPDTSYSPLDVTHRGEKSNMFLNCTNSGSPYFGSGQGLVKSQKWMSSSARTDTKQSSLGHFLSQCYSEGKTQGGLARKGVDMFPQLHYSSRKKGIGM